MSRNGKSSVSFSNSPIYMARFKVNSTFCIHFIRRTYCLDQPYTQRITLHLKHKRLHNRNY
jgi:hypothetical protein